jgi:hypothetical protein
VSQDSELIHSLLKIFVLFKNEVKLYPLNILVFMFHFWTETMILIHLIVNKFYQKYF